METSFPAQSQKPLQQDFHNQGTSLPQESYLFATVPVTH